MAERMDNRGSHDSNGSKRVRALVGIVGIVLPMAAALVNGCGSSSAAPPAAGMPSATVSTPVDAAVTYVSVTTGGGGGAGSSGTTSMNPFGATSSSGGSMDATVGDDDAGDAMASMPDAAPTNACPNYVAPNCGATACDLRSNTCCVDFSFDTRCIPGANAKCNSNEATLHCTSACECEVGSVCCGVENTILGVVQTQCQAVPDGGLCNPHPQTTTQASAQICQTTDECRNGQDCIKQTCIYGATLSVCGLQSQDPFDCEAAAP
jgi:hypothetical protein